MLSLKNLPMFQENLLPTHWR